MKSTLIKFLAAVLVLCMIIPITASCGKKYTGGDTLVVGYDIFSEKFSPFFAKTAYDQDVADMTQVSLLLADREGNVVLKGKSGEVIPYNGTDYKYEGLADCTITQNDDGTVIYEFDLRRNVRFSDGERLTADDVIFSMYVLSDPTYIGSSTFYTLPIKGMKEYRAGMTALYVLILEAGRDATEFTNYTKEDADKYWEAMDKAGVDFAQDIVDYVLSNYGEYASSPAYGGKWGTAITADSPYAVAYGMRMWRFGSWVKNEADEFTGAFKDINGKVYDCVNTFPTTEDYWDNLDAAYGGNYVELNATEAANADLFALVDEKLGDEAAKYNAGIVTGETVDKIEGIEKTGNYSLKVTMTEFDATSIYKFALSVSPMHYYGDKAKYDYDKNMFGFTKGDLSSVRAKTTTPMGAGPYKFVSFENGIVLFECNENYYKGIPKIKYIKFQEVTNEADKVAGIASGTITIDISNPSVNDEILQSIKDANPNKELTGDVITYNAVDNLGYGYIGINANNVKVGQDPASDASKALRKAFATLFAVYRDTVIASYYGERAQVIQYPISNTSWAAPRPSDSDYAIAYSKDVEGNPIFTDGMTETQKYDAALQAAIGFFKAAGYTWDEASKKFTAAPAGAKLTYELIIPGEGIGEHPAYGILTSTKSALETIGITISINDPSDSNVLWTAVESGTCEMWAAAWGATPDPDMYQIYHSSNTVGKGGTDSNLYDITDAELDELIMVARKSSDTSFRKATYKRCLEIIMEWGVEIPTYQRQNCILFSSARINIDTLTPDITTFWGWAHDLELLEMN